MNGGWIAANGGALSGVLGSILLAVPALSGLSKRKGFEAARREWKNGALSDAQYFGTFEEYAAEIMGAYTSNRRWNLVGLLCLAAAFGWEFVA